MPPESWTYWLLFAVAGFHLLAVLYRHLATPATTVATGDRAAEPAREVGTGEVACRECGTVNEQEYRFCRRCVAELPGATELETRSRAPAGREIP